MPPARSDIAPPELDARDSLLSSIGETGALENGPSSLKAMPAPQKLRLMEDQGSPLHEMEEIPMKSQSLLVALLITNIAFLGFQVVHPRAEHAATIPAVLRAHALELVDDHGRIRAEIKVLPAQVVDKMPDGSTQYPETVLLRLINSKNGPDVKLATTEDGAGLSLGGDSGYVQILSRGVNPPFIKIVNKDGQQQVMKP